jgi:hypothetical protein
VKAGWRLAPSSFWILGKWGNLSCGGWYHFHDACNMEACLLMGHGRDLGLTCHLADCTNLISGQKLADFFLAEVAQSSSLNSMVAHSHRSQCCALASGSCAGYHCSGLALKIHCALMPFFAAPACGSARPPTC